MAPDLNTLQAPLTFVSSHSSVGPPSRRVSESRYYNLSYRNECDKHISRTVGKAGLCKPFCYIAINPEQQQTIPYWEIHHTNCFKKMPGNLNVLSDQRKQKGSTRAAGAPVAPHCNISIGYEPKAFRLACCLEDINESQQVQRCKKCRIASHLSKPCLCSK